MDVFFMIKMCFSLLILTFLIKLSIATNFDNYMYDLRTMRQDASSEFNTKISDSNLVDDNSVVLSRNKRFLIFPAQTLVQFSLCTVSTADIKRNIFVNSGFQLNWITPNRTSQLPSTFFVVPPVITVAVRKKRDEESAEHNAMYEEMIDMFNEITTEQVYYLMETLLNHNGYNGTACLLHSICQMSTIPLHQNGDVFHEVLQFLLTPSEHSSPESDENNKTDKKLLKGYVTVENPTPIWEYHKAEMLGRSYNGDYNTNHCDDYYSCPNSPLDKITHIVFDENY